MIARPIFATVAVAGVAFTVLNGCESKQPNGNPSEAIYQRPAVTIVSQTPTAAPEKMRDVSAVRDDGAGKDRRVIDEPVILPASTRPAPGGRVLPESSASAMLRIETAYTPPRALLARDSNDTTAEQTLFPVVSKTQGEGPTLSGLDVLKRENFARLKGRRIAMLVNHSAIDREGRHILDLTRGNPNVQIVKLFSPEHGLYGDVDTKTPDFVDTRTQLMVHSLYRSTTDTTVKPHHPRPQDLDGLDLVLVDMQDIGARFYTYCGYMAFMMEECAKKNVEVMVLDRPNPIGGLYVDGPLPDEDQVGGVTCYFPMPVAHGMTMGELARMFNEENKIGCRLTVVQMEKWARSMFWDETGLRWVNPSPNIQDLDAAIAYPGIGMTERLVSMGRGTTEPFHIFGTPWIQDNNRMCDELNAAGMAGVRLEPVEFTPTGTLARGHIGENKLCRGARIVITDRKAFRPLELGLRVMDWLHRNHGKPAGGAPPAYDVAILRTSASAITVLRIREGRKISETLEFVKQQVRRFEQTRKKYLLYPDTL